MSFQANKIRRLWFPFSILAIIVLTVGWILAGVVYPYNVQGNVLTSELQETPTATTTPTELPTSTTTPQPTATQTAFAPTETTSVNCTYTQFYWSTYPHVWRIENIVLGNLSFTKVEAVEILTKTEPGPTERLLGQFFSALLNTLEGADSTEIDSIMVIVRDWLILNPHGLELSEAELLEIQTYTAHLQEYNRGIIGPGLCSDEPVTPTPASTSIPTATATSPPGTVIPFFTPTATKSNGNRPKQTNPPSSAQPTNTPQPKPTKSPLPTPTTVVPPTDAPTSLPPTSAPTLPPPTSPPPSATSGL